MSGASAECPVHVIEASAGTGKTFRITRLVVDLVASGMPIDRIVLSSYTNAAADELAERVRAALAEVLDPPANGDMPRAMPDAVTAGRLRRAIADLDGASIGTIHSFCARLLQETAEVAGALSLDGMSPDDAASDLQAEVVADLWAACVAQSHLALSMLGGDPASAQRTLSKIVAAVDGEPDAHIEPARPWVSIPQLERQIDDLIDGDGAACRASIAEIITNFNKSAAESLEAMVAASEPTPSARQAVLEGAHELRAVPGGDWPAHGHKQKRSRVQEWARSESGARAVRVMQQLDADYQAARVGFRAALARRARAALASRRDARRTYSFGDLVARTWQLVSAPESALVAHARSRYAVAIIDECQDTDPIQQSIYSAIFSAPGHQLYVVGDPKQSIYGFRGADLPSYISLRNSGVADEPLATSFRSDAAHVAAVEALFTANENPFGDPGISFVRIAARNPGPRCMGGDGSAQSGVEAIALDAGAHVSSQRAAAMRATAARIREWLAWPAPCGLSVPAEGMQEGARRAVQPGDIAVLCHRRGDLDVMRLELGRLGIPSVYSVDTSVLLSPAAEDMHAILAACASCRTAQLAIGAAMTRALGATASDVRARGEWWIGAIRSCAQSIERSGIDAALIDLLERPIPDARAGADEGRSAMELLLAQPGGERHAVDLQHVRELLGEAERTGTHGAAALAHWIRTERDAADRASGRGGGDTARLRTQATKDAVTLQTLHSSKGLTYGLVCLPTIAIGAKRPQNDDIVRATATDADGTARRVIDLGSDEREARARTQQQERRREESRLLYVAITRARYLTSVCVPLARAGAVPPSALDGLLASQCGGGDATADRKAQLDAWAARAARVHAQIDPKVAAAREDGAPQRSEPLRIITSMPRWTGLAWSPSAAADMAALDPPVEDWADSLRDVSFTSLTRGAAHAESHADRDALPAERDLDEGSDTDHGSAAADEGTPPSRGDSDAACASALDGAIRRLGVRGVDLGVAMHAALDCAFGALAGVAEAGGGERDAQDPLEDQVVAQCAAVSGGAMADGLRPAARDLAHEARCALVQPLGHGCPSVVELARRPGVVLRELRISVPLDLRHDALADAFRSCGGDIGARVAPALARTSAARMRGLLSGIIDIAAHARSREWHIIDWKTNDLGRDPRAYSGHALEDAAARSLYPIQAALYMMLLTRWLRRIGDQSDVVASHYLYLRGMDAATPGTGVWSWSPGAELIAALDEAVGAAGAAAHPGGEP